MDRRFEKVKPSTALETILNEKKQSVSKNSKNLNFSFEDYCCKQKYSSSFVDWQKCGLLSKALETLTGYSQSPVIYDHSKFTLYNDFPSKTQTLYEFPEHVTPDASWVRIHVTGPAVIVGHIVNNTFYVVFLDKTHKFFLTAREVEKNFGKKALKPSNKSK